MLSAVLEFLSKVFCFSSYVSNKASYPQPLSAEEEAAELEKYKNGDMTARETLIKHTAGGAWAGGPWGPPPPAGGGGR